MSKQSKSKRERKKRRSSKATTAAAGGKRQTESGPDWTKWRLVGGISIAALVLGAVLWFVVGPGRSSEGESSSPMPTDPIERNGMYDAPPPMVIDREKTYSATIETETGDIVLELVADKVPNTVNSFVYLARQGFFDNTTFHRVLPGFMAQAGDPAGTGAGGPGYQFPDEFHPDLKHDRPGILSMANSGADSNGSQFFITYVPAPWLDAFDEAGTPKDCQRSDVSCHAVFGQVIAGIDVLEGLTLRDPSQNPAFSGDLISTIRIREQ